MFDESYEHDKRSGHATKVTVGGCIADAGAWVVLSGEWAAALERFEVSAFHMTDFEANQRAFRGWDQYPERRHALLATLLDIGTRYIRHFLGVAREVENASGKEAEAYRLCVSDLVKQLAGTEHQRHRCRFSIVFAKQSAFRAEMCRIAIEKDGGERFGSVSSNEPESMSPLQLADIVAYEISRAQRFGGPERYPFRRLRDVARHGYGTFSLSWR